MPPSDRTARRKAHERPPPGRLVCALCGRAEALRRVGETVYWCHGCFVRRP